MSEHRPEDPLAYEAFLASKRPRPQSYGIQVADLPAGLFAHQAHCARFALERGRAGIFLDTGLGKTLIELVFLNTVAAATGSWGLLLCPLAVAWQIVREAERFGIEARVIREQSDAGPGVNVCNYDRLGKLDLGAFGAVALDEASILKSFTGKTTRLLIDVFAGYQFRLTATATPAPNDHMELGQQAEFLGVMDSNEMLMRWFITDQTQMGRYRLKGHGERDFYDWMASWGRMAESPEDLGYDGSRFKLPPLEIVYHRAETAAPIVTEGLFASSASATEIHDIKRQTNEARAALAGELAMAGFKDWRLPTVEELFVLADRSRVRPAIDTDFFPETPSDWFRSSTLWASSPSGVAWGVYFGGGYSGWGYQDYEGFVRAVRPGQSVG